MEGSQILKKRGCWSPRRPLADKFLHEPYTYIPTSTTKFKLLSSINWGVMERSKTKIKLEVVDPQIPPSDKFYMEP